MEIGAPDPLRVRTREDLARELTALRSAVGLTVRDLARALDSPVATVGDYFSGRHLPGPRQLPLFRSILGACGVTDPAAVDSWVEALAGARRASDGRAARSRSPYKGLEAFGDGDADLFFGRQAVLDELLAVVRRVADHGEAGLVTLVGPSGSGKSSLLMAGLVPAVRNWAVDTAEGAWQVVAGGADLVESDQAEVVAGPGPTLVVIDQFEEVLTVDTDRRRELLATLGGMASRAVVVVALRADFYQAAAAEPVLIDGLRRHQVLLGPMTADELRDAVVEPGRRAGSPVEDGLVDLVLRDLAPATGLAPVVDAVRAAGPTPAYEDGALPLLSYALLAAWERADRNRVTIADYLAVGGLRGAVRQAAENLYGSMTEAEQVQARRLFARLVRVDGEGPPTRRRAARAELVDSDADAGEESVLERFVSARLVTVETGAVQISHESLLGVWPRLGEWVESDREWLALRQQLSDAARAWERADHDESLLWRGTRLARAAEESASPGRELNRLESRFLAASLDERDAAQVAERRRVRRTQQLLAIVAVVAVVALAVGAYAVASRADAVASRADAVAARDQALSREVAIEAQQLLQRAPSLAAQLAVAAYRIAPTVQARSTLVDMTAAEIPYRILGPSGPTFLSASRDGKILAAAYSGSDTVTLYRKVGEKLTKVAELRAGPASQQDFAVAVSPDGRLLAVGGTDHTVTVWDTTDPAHPARLATLAGPTSTVYDLAFSPDQRRLAAADADGAVHWWDIADPRHPSALGPLRLPGSPALKAVAFSGDGKMVAAAGVGVVAVWHDPLSGAPPSTDTSGVSYTRVVFDPAGNTVSAAASDGSVHISGVGAGGTLTPSGTPIDTGGAQVDSLAVSPDGGRLAAGAADGRVHVYDIASRKELFAFTGSDPVTAALYGPSGGQLITADSAGTLQTWPLPPPSAASAPGNVFFLNWLHGGHTLMATVGGPKGSVVLYDTTHAAGASRAVEAADITLPAGLGPVGGTAAPTPGARYVIAAAKKGPVEILDISDPAHPRPIAGPLGCTRPLVEQLTVTLDGRLLVSGDDSGKLCVWNITDRSHPRLVGARTDTSKPILGFNISRDGRLLADAGADGKVRLYRFSPAGSLRPVATLGGFSNDALTTAFTPDGRTLMAGGADGLVRMWDITHPERPQPLGPPLAGPTGYAYQLDVSPDGHTLAVATTDHAVWLWDISTRAHPVHLETLTKAADAVFAVRFSPDGTTLAASGSDRVVHLWEYQPARAESALCAEVGQAVTRQEWTRSIQGLPYRRPCG